MDFQQTWRQKVQERLARFAASGRAGFARAGPGLLYGFLSGMTLWPVAEAMQDGDLVGPVAALASVAGGVGGNLIANLVQRWQDEADAAEQLSQAAQDNPALVEALDATLRELKVIDEAQAGMSDEDREWFQQTLRREVAELGSSLTVVTVTGSGAAAVGKGATAAGAGGVAVGGDVHGNIIIGGQRTDADEKGTE